MKKIDFNKIKINKIIIFSPNWIGDAVMSMPLVNAIKDAFASAYIVVAARPYVGCLWKTNALVNEVWDFDAPQLCDFPAYLKFFRTILKKQFDLAIILPLGLRYTLLTFLAGIPYRIGYGAMPRRFFLTHALDYNSNLKSKHMVDNYLDFLRATGINPKVKEPLLNIDFNSQNKAEKILKENNIEKENLVIGIAPGAIYGPAKRWPKEKYAELIKALINKYSAWVFVFTGPKENMLAQWLRQNAGNRFVIFFDDYLLSEVMGLVKKCNVFIGNDSGLGHVACAMNIKTISLFGSTSPQWTAPRGERNITLNKHLPCGPCFARTCKLGHYACLHSISVKDVIEAVSVQLDEVKSR